MKLHFCFWAVNAVLVFVPLAAAQAASAGPAGSKPLFDLNAPSTWRWGTDDSPAAGSAVGGEQGADADQKKAQELHALWRVEQGEQGAEIVGDGGALHLASPQDYGDFELWVDWKIQPGGDSGIYLRGVPQVQIWDPANPEVAEHGAAKGSGGLWNNEKHERFPSSAADRPPGAWNRMHITMVGPYVTVELNDQPIVNDVVLENFHDRTKPVAARGPIYLQAHGSEVRFRNLYVREIDTDEANRRLATIDGDDSSFENLFDGKSFDGWTGATDAYEVERGTLRSKASEIGNILTKGEFGDFVLRFEFRLPPAGNNGLAIRVPSDSKEPHLDGIELQILDNTAEQYKELKPYQFHGSAYGLAPALQGFLRPVGEWNYEQVTVRGDRVEVNLNGFPILDVDLAKVRSKPLDGLEHPGASRSAGHIGFCGHGDAVSFRNIRIKKLESAK